MGGSPFSWRGDEADLPCVLADGGEIGAGMVAHSIEQHGMGVVTLGGDVGARLGARNPTGEQESGRGEPKGQQAVGAGIGSNKKNGMEIGLIEEG